MIHRGLLKSNVYVDLSHICIVKWLMLLRMLYKNSSSFSKLENFNVWFPRVCRAFLHTGISQIGFFWCVLYTNFFCRPNLRIVQITEYCSIWARNFNNLWRFFLCRNICSNAVNICTFTQNYNSYIDFQNNFDIIILLYFIH